MKTLLHIFILAFFALQGQAQLVTISGIVTDDTGLPLPGVNIIEKGTSKGTQTDFDGKYEIETYVGSKLVFSYVGFDTIERKVKEKTTTINIQMVPNSALEEVVVTAYAPKRQKSVLGYAVSSSKSVKIRGVASGVQISNPNGLVGSASQIKIRGYKNLDTDDESYGRIVENIFKRVETAPLSTFSIDVDKAGYSNVRRFINNGQKVPQDAVKVEEMINYFAYNYPQPKGDEPFSITTEIASSPWNDKAKLVRIGLKGKDITTAKVPASNLVFLLDVSGSMGDPNKLPLLKSALQVLVDQLREVDRVSIVVYAGAAGLILPPTSGAEKQAILNAINNLESGGSTAGGEGIKLAYKIAEENFIKGGNNRVILATDGDFNVGASSDRAMEDLIVDKRKSGVFLTCLGFGMGNYQDAKMETLADKGNGNHAYIDTMQEARKVLGTEFFGTIYTIAKDVKIQVEFNPNKVQAYRLVGYENRLLNDEDFKDDTKDAGELGSGHTVTALYEVIPVGVKSMYVKDVDNLKYTKTSNGNFSDEMLTVKFRYKEPAGDKSKLIVKTVNDTNTSFTMASEDFKYAAAVALFGMQLRKSVFINTQSAKDVIALAEAGKGPDNEGYRAEFIRLVKSYK
ncbi:Ca-activated chloride channel family protein [Ulvibacter sp. MAR_2010_11]|uniref:vWA domain-containing protein n=1 Tax=Ulvibacter sp. MAR_2010_11 TaxID=1250229 RepID=UPI000C2C42C6|nr:VWA domain-containing protein [Ulvibacter sp. MAR_2010_11]PKA84549.1 Ca-activated chloride channel family protein [Ulvibacter sp. MAR_2010_11]